MTRAVREQRLDALVLGHVMDDAEQARTVAPILGELDDLDVQTAAAVLAGDAERHRMVLAPHAGERSDVGDEHVGRQHRSEVAGEITVTVEAEQHAVARVRVDELALLVVADADDEGRLRKRVEDRAHIRRGRRHRVVPHRPGCRLAVDLHAAALPRRLCSMSRHARRGTERQG